MEPWCDSQTDESATPQKNVWACFGSIFFWKALGPFGGGEFPSHANHRLDFAPISPAPITTGTLGISKDTFLALLKSSDVECSNAWRIPHKVPNKKQISYMAARRCVVFIQKLTPNVCTTGCPKCLCLWVCLSEAVWCGFIAVLDDCIGAYTTKPETRASNSARSMSSTCPTKSCTARKACKPNINYNKKQQT